jgi:DNA repair protein RecO (recombination protein O)
MIIETSAVVLSTLKYGDSSRIVRLYARDSGKTSVIAKGARSAKNKYGSALQPLSYINISYYKKAHSDLHLLGNAEIALPFRKIQESLDHMTAGLMILESISQTAQENEPNIDLFDLLLNALAQLNELKPNPFAVFIVFQLHLIRELGFNIDFSLEHLNQNNSDVYFSLETGTIVPVLMKHYKNVIRFDKEVYLLLLGLSQLPDDRLSDIEINTAGLNNIIDFFVKYIGFHLEKKFSYKSYNVLGNM